MTPAIEVRQLTKCYGALAALDTVDLQIEQGEFLHYSAQMVPVKLR